MAKWPSAPSFHLREYLGFGFSMMWSGGRGFCLLPQNLEVGVPDFHYLLRKFVTGSCGSWCFWRFWMWVLRVLDFPGKLGDCGLKIWIFWFRVFLGGRYWRICAFGEEIRFWRENFPGEFDFWGKLWRGYWGFFNLQEVICCSVIENQEVCGQRIDWLVVCFLGSSWSYLDL